MSAYLPLAMVSILNVAVAALNVRNALRNRRNADRNLDEAVHLSALAADLGPEFAAVHNRIVKLKDR